MAKRTIKEKNNSGIFESLCQTLNFSIKDGVSETIFEKDYTLTNGTKYTISVNFSVENGSIDYGPDMQKGRGTTCNFSDAENAVVLECVDRLITKGYEPVNIELEHPFTVGHGPKWLDVLVKHPNGKTYMMIECKTFGTEFDAELRRLKNNKNSGSGDDANQLISYFAQDRNADVILLYGSQIVNNSVEKEQAIIYTESLKECRSATEVFETWNKETLQFGIFEPDISPYTCRDVMYRGDLEPLTEKLSGKIFNDFLEILRHNGISDKPNAFNKLLNLFLCKIVDEKKNEDEAVEFYWTANTTYRSMQNVLESLYKRGMEDFLQIDIYDPESDSIRKKLNILGVSKDIVDDICKVLDDTKLYKSSEFAFKDIYNETTFLDNAKVLKEMVQLIQPYQFRYGHKQQFLGVFFENLLATSIKQEAGQFFTPVPIADFMISSMPLKEKLKEKVESCINPNRVNTLMPTAIDYSCGSGHFLTAFMDIAQQVIDDFDAESITNISTKKKFKSYQSDDPNADDKFVWVDNCIYGVEKDYRLVKTTKISTFLNGDGDANIIYADGLTAFNEGRFKDYELLQKPHQFDYVIANPPYSVDGFKRELTNTEFSGYEFLTDNSKEIECLFVERTAQLLKDGGIAAIVLPKSIIDNSGIYEDSRENIIKNFYIRAIAKMGKHTFMATNVETVIMFLEKRPAKDYEATKLCVEKFMSDYKDFNYNGKTDSIKHYAESYDLDFDDYVSILKGVPTDRAKASDYYRLRKYKAKKKQTTKLTEQQVLIDYLLSRGNTTVVVDTGEKEAEKAFLGYEFSTRKGQEGLHEYEEGSMLYGKNKDNSVDLTDDTNKVNYFIRESFKNADAKSLFIPECLQENLRITTQEALFDFSKGNKINLQPLIKYESKYSQDYIYELHPKLESGSRPAGGKTRLTDGIMSIGGENITKLSTLDLKNISYVSQEYYDSQTTGKIVNGDILINKDGACTGKLARYVSNEPALSNEHCFVVNFGANQDYMFYLLQHSVYNQMLNQIAQKATQAGLSQNDFYTIKVPIIPDDIQKLIVSECSAIDEEVLRAINDIEILNNQIYSLVSTVKGEKIPLSDNEFFFSKAGGDAPEEIRHSKNALFTTPIFSNGTDDNALYGYCKPSESDITHDAITISARGTIGFTALRTAPFLPIVRLICIYPINDNIDIQYARIAIQYANINRAGSAIDQLTIPMLNDIYITIPDMAIQKKVINECLTLEAKINKCKQVLDTARKKKDSIIDKYLQ